MNPRAIEGKSILVTGASGGIGAALVSAFLDAGAARVHAAARSAIAPSDARIAPCRLDITSREEVERAASALAVDILVNNAGVNTNRNILADDPGDGPLHEMTVNYFGLLNMCRAFAPRMRTRGSGLIVNILSSASLAPVPRMGSYCASKAAAWSLTQCLRAELEGSGVEVIAIYPGATDTRLTAHLSNPKLSPAQVAEGTIMAIRDGLLEHKMKMGMTHFDNSLNASRSMS